MIYNELFFAQDCILKCDTSIYIYGFMKLYE